MVFPSEFSSHFRVLPSSFTTFTVSASQIAWTAGRQALRVSLPKLGWVGSPSGSLPGLVSKCRYTHGVDSPSPVGPLLLWQQPHPIYYAELVYRQKPTRQTLERFETIVEQTAEFMASFAVRDPATGQFVLGPPMKTVSENTDQRTTKNAPFELTYWRYGLNVAQAWRERLGRPRKAEWDAVLEGLAPLPQADGVYLFQQETLDTYTNWNWEHPALIGIRGVLPGDGVDPATHRRSVERVMAVWEWDRCWGWDFPMVAMTATRLQQPEEALEALFKNV